MRTLGIWLLEGAAWAAPMGAVLYLLDIEVTWKILLVCVASAFIADAIAIIKGSYK